MVLQLEIPALNPDLLSRQVPTQVYAGGWLKQPEQTLCIWNSHRFQREQVKGAVLGFYGADVRFESLYQKQEAYAWQFAAWGWGSVIEPDYSLWRDQPLLVQLWSVYRTRY